MLSTSSQSYVTFCNGVGMHYLLADPFPVFCEKPAGQNLPPSPTNPSFLLIIFPFINTLFFVIIYALRTKYLEKAMANTI